MQNTLWLIVAIVVVVIIVLAVVGFVMSRRGRRVGFEPKALPMQDVEGREERIDEIERMFVHQPREAVAAARLMVDEMLTRMGYPVRLTSAERSRDLSHFNRSHADRYRVAGELRDDASTEEMRRALKGYLDTARDIVAEARGRAARDQPVLESPQPAVRPAGQPAVEERPVAEDRRVVEERPVADDRTSNKDRPAAG
jgi:FtsZ-interacting cell division protein ZipA